MAALVSFDDAIALTPIGPSRFGARTPPSWMASGRAPGGLVEAQLLAAIEACVDDPERRPLSFTAHLLRAPADGPYEIQVEVLREGRTTTNLSGVITQAGKVIATSLAIFAVGRPGPDFDELPMPAVAPPTPGRELDSYIPPFAHPYGDNIVAQDRGGPAPFSAPDGPMERIGWVGFAVPRPVDAPGLVMIGDVGMMAWWVRLDHMHTTATLDHTTHFRADLRHVDVTDMVLISSRTGLVRAGYLDWDVVVWAPDGTVLCQSRQVLAILG